MAEQLTDAEIAAVRQLIAIPARQPFDWNNLGRWAMHLIEVVVLGYVAHLGWNADTKAEQAAVNSTHAIGLVNEGIEIGRANHAAIRETQGDVKTVKDKVVPRKTP